MIQRTKSRIARILRWSERYTQTDMLYLARGGFWLTLTRFFSITTSLLTSIAFANLLPETVYGVYRFVLSMLPILAIPTLTGINTALVRAVAQGKVGTLRLALSTKVRWGLFGGVASLLLAGYYYWNDNVELTLSFLIAALFIPIMDPFGLFVPHLTGQKNFKRSMFFQSTVQIVPALILIGVALTTNSIVIIVAAYFLSYTIFRSVFLYVLLRETPRTSPADPQAIQFGKHLSLMSILGVVSTSLDKILVFHYTGAAALAGYYLALMPVKQVQLALGSISTLALPKFSENDAVVLKQTLPWKILKLYSFVVPIVIGYAALSPYVFSLVFPKYVDFYLLSVFFMAQLLFFPINLFHTAIVSRGEKKKLYIQSTSYAIVRIALILALVPPYGFWGAAFAIMLTGILNSIVTTYLFFRLR